MHAACFHCGLDVSQPGEFTLLIDNQDQQFCCPGCRAVASTIIDGGFKSYYNFRTSMPDTPGDDLELRDYSLYDQPEFQGPFVDNDGELPRAHLQVHGISCAACGWLIEKALGQVEGVQEVRLNLARHQVSVSWDPQHLALSQIMLAIEHIGYTPSPWTGQAEEESLQAENKLALRRLGVAGIGMMQVGMYATALHAGAMQGISDPVRDFLRFVSLLVATLVVFYSSRTFFEAAARNLKNRSVGMDVPVSLAIGLAYAASVWATVSRSGDVYFDSVVMFTFFLLGSRYLEMRARHHNIRATRGIGSLLPPYAWREQGEDNWQQVPADRLNKGDRILVKSGEVIPADAEVISGRSSVDESNLTGEYLPVAKETGDALLAGSLNTDGSLQAVVSGTGADSSLSLINRLLDQAQQSKPHMAWLADRISGYFVIFVLISAALAATYWLFNAPEKALWISLSVLVVSCPCALSLATPTALVNAIGALKERGILLRNSNTIESIRKADTFVFDKTGTLTSGQLTLEKTTILGGVNEQECLAIAASLETHSNHPIATAFNHIKQHPVASDIEVVTGKGIAGTIEGRRYRMGSADFAGISGQPNESQTEITVYLSADSQLLASFTLSDSIRPSAAVAIKELHQLGLHTVVLSGDNSPAVEHVCANLGIKELHKGLAPQDKLSMLEQLSAQGRHIVMVGDGVNDVPVMAAAPVSVAVTNATDLAKANADAMLLSGDLRLLLTLRKTALRCQSVIRQNLGWALSYNVLAIPFAAFGFIPPWVAALGMSGSSLVVLANATRLNNAN